MNKFTLLIFPVFMLLSVFPAETMEQLSLEETAQRSQRENPQVIKAFRAIKKAQRDKTGNNPLMASTISLNGTYGNSSNNTQTASTGISDPEVSGKTTISIPILNQLSIGGSVTAKEGNNFTGEATLTVKPFAASPPSYTWDTAYAKAMISWEYLLRQTYYEAEKQVLNWQLSGMKQDQSQAEFDLETHLSETMEAKLELGEASFNELQDQLSALTDARKALYSAQSAKVSAWKDMRQLFNPESDAFEPIPLALSELEERIAQRRARLKEITDSESRPNSSALALLKLDLESYRKELRATPVWRPDFNVTGSMAFPDTKKSSVGITLTFAPNDVKTDNRQDIKDSILDTLTDMQMEEYNLNLQQQLLNRNIEIARQAFSVAKIIRRQAQLTFKETEFLYSQGDRTIFERDKALLSLQNSELECFSAAVDWYVALGELLVLYGVGM